MLLSKNVHREPSPLDTQDDIIIEVGMNNKGSVLILMVIVIALVIVMGLSVLNTAAKQYEIKSLTLIQRNPSMSLKQELMRPM